MLLERRSARVLAGPGPDDGALDLILAAAMRAPDHGRLRPWRFVVIRGAARERLGAALADHLRASEPQASAAALERERRKAQRAPVIVAVAARVQPEARVPPHEQVLSAAAAAHAMLLAAYALGFNAVWKTGSGAYADSVKTALGLEVTDSLVGFIYIGSEPGERARTPREDWRALATELDPAP